MCTSLPRIIFFLTTCAWVSFPQSSWAQQKIDWRLLEALDYVSVMDSSLGYAYYQPVFPDKIKVLDAKEVTIKGYIIPIDAEGEAYALSAFPFSACFFCGGAGRESVIELTLKDDDQEFMLDEIVTLGGTLRLGHDPFGLLYYIEGAYLVE
ncbi:MAG: DUF3299 domain-containing protein [Bacteroidota bacterium]